MFIGSNLNGNYNELLKRCEEVFEMQEGDIVYSICLDNGQLIIEMEEIDVDGNYSGIFDYLPNMTERPEALAYLMGNRDDFND
jgi:hypothetical protein